MEDTVLVKVQVLRSIYNEWTSARTAVGMDVQTAGNRSFSAWAKLMNEKRKAKDEANRVKVDNAGD